MSDRITHTVAGVLEQIDARGRHICVGLSGGVDSTVLVDTLDRLRTEFQLTLSAIHINHQISGHSSEWEIFCKTLCEGRGIELTVRRVTVVDDGSSIEASARALRYQAYASVGSDFVALAHHLDDQAETFLLQLLRGAGPKGLAGMPVVRRHEGHAPLILRPLLALRRDAIESHAKARRLAWIEDDSNTSSRYDRNFLRNELLPLLESRFPGYRDTMTRVTRNLADYLRLADDLAALDAGETLGSSARVEQLRQFSDPRALNLLRYLFARSGLPMPQRAIVEEALRQCREARADAEMRIGFGSHALRCYRGNVELIDESRVPQPGWQMQWDGRQILFLPEGLGSLHPRPAIGSGIATRHFLQHAALVRGRHGGESMRPARNRPNRTLKNLLQENAVPPWERARMPLLFFGEHLAWVPGIGVAAEFRAGDAEPGVEPEWQKG